MLVSELDHAPHKITNVKGLKYIDLILGPPQEKIQQTVLVKEDPPREKEQTKLIFP